MIMQHLRLMMLSAGVLLLVGMSVPVQAQDTPEESGQFMFDRIYVNPGPEPEHISAYTDPAYKNKDKYYEHYVALNTIQWALENARVTVITDGEYEINHPISITNSGTRLVIGPKAEIKYSGPRHTNVIEVNRADDVQVFNLGTLNGNAGAGVQFNGQTGGGSGIEGGMIFGTGSLANVRAGYWLVDTDNVKVPLALSETPVYAVTGMEGAHDTRIGTVAQLTSEVFNDGSTVDVTMNNKRAEVQHVIGPSPDPKTEVVHLNNSHDVTVNRITGLTGSNGGNHSLTMSDVYDVPGLTYQAEEDRPLFGLRTERPVVSENNGFKQKNVNRVHNDVASFSKEVSYPDFPNSLPELNVDVRLTAEFEDGSGAELFKKSYSFDLQE